MNLVSSSASLIRSSVEYSLGSSHISPITQRSKSPVHVYFKFLLRLYTFKSVRIVVFRTFYFLLFFQPTTFLSLCSSHTIYAHPHSRPPDVARTSYPIPSKRSMDNKWL